MAFLSYVIFTKLIMTNSVTYKGGINMNDVLEKAEELMEKEFGRQIKKLEELREKVSSADDIVFFTKDNYLELLDAYIFSEKTKVELRNTIKFLRKR